MKSGSLNLLETSGLVQTCTGIALSVSLQAGILSVPFLWTVLWFWQNFRLASPYKELRKWKYIWLFSGLLFTRLDVETRPQVLHTHEVLMLTVCFSVISQYYLETTCTCHVSFSIDCCVFNPIMTHGQPMTSKWTEIWEVKHLQIHMTDIFLFKVTGCMLNI